MNNYDDKRVNSVMMSQEKLVSILNDLIFHSIKPREEVGSAYKSNMDNMITSINNAIKHFELSDYELGEVIRCGDHGYLTFPGLVKIIPFEEQSQDDVTISKEDEAMEWDDRELEELRAEALETTKYDGVEPKPLEPVKRGDLLDILATLQAEDDDEDSDEDLDKGLNSAQLVKSIEWLRLKNISAEDIVDFVKYVFE